MQTLRRNIVRSPIIAACLILALVGANPASASPASSSTCTQTVTEYTSTTDPDGNFTTTTSDCDSPAVASSGGGVSIMASFYGEDNQNCHTNIVANLLGVCARARATVSWVSDSLCPGIVVGSPRDEYCLDFLFTAEGKATGGGEGIGITDHAGSVNLRWSLPASSDLDSIPHRGIHQHSTAPTGCHNMHTYVTTTNIGGFAVDEIANACWSI